MHFSFILLGASCEDGWFEVEKSCFKIFSGDVFVNWQIARQNCRTHGGDLAIVDTEIKRKAMNTRLAEKDQLLPNIDIQVFIGIQRLGLWQWLENEQISVDSWHRGYPFVSPLQKCGILGRLSQWKLFQSQCNFRESYLCETEESTYINTIILLYSCHLRQTVDYTSPRVPVVSLFQRLKWQGQESPRDKS